MLPVQFSSDGCHGPLYGLIPALAPEAQCGRASAVKGITEPVPLILVSIAIAPLVGRRRLGWEIVATGGAPALTMAFVREHPCLSGSRFPTVSHTAQLCTVPP